MRRKKNVPLAHCMAARSLGKLGILFDVPSIGGCHINQFHRLFSFLRYFGATACTTVLVVFTAACAVYTALITFCLLYTSRMCIRDRVGPYVLFFFSTQADDD